MSRYGVLPVIGLLVGLLTLTACASSGPSDSSVRQDVITAEEIEATSLPNLYEVVLRLRPRWLEIRSSQSFNSNTEVVVYQGQTYLGGVDVLREFGRETARQLRYLDGPRASATLPGLSTRQVEAAIVIDAR